MTKEKVSQYIIKGNIPISFIDKKNNYKYDLYCNNGKYFTTSFNLKNPKKYTFPKWVKEDDKYYLQFRSVKRSDEIRPLDKLICVIFYSSMNTFEQCLSNFIYWFEINKSSFTDIKYYKS